MEPDKLMFLGMQAIVASKAMRDMLGVAERVARSQATVLILGESGSGKELVARAIHQYSPRSNGPWVDLSCAALPEHLLESELFGYEKGAFSGAERSKAGLFEMANQGTIFLDEIGELELKMQAKLLRALDGVPYYRLGGTRKISVEVRVIAATNQDLKHAVAQGRFREDLYHRISQFTLRVPPLRERTEDIRALALHFLAQAGLGQSLSICALQSLEAHRWPGNIRELRNVITSASLCALSNEITGQDIQPTAMVGERMEYVRPVEAIGIPISLLSAALSSATSAIAQPASLESMEHRAIHETLATVRGHRQKAAEQLGISRRTLHRKLKRYGKEMIGNAP